MLSSDKAWEVPRSMAKLLNDNIVLPSVRSLVLAFNIYNWLLGQYDVLNIEIAQLKSENATLKDLEKAESSEVDHLRREVVELRESLEEKDEKIVELKQRVYNLATKVEDFESSSKVRAGHSTAVRQQEPSTARGSERLANESQKMLSKAEQDLARAKRELAEKEAARGKGKGKA